MTEVSVHEAKTHLSRLLQKALDGEEVIIKRSGRALVRLQVLEGAPAKRKLGSAKGDFVVPAEFDGPLPDSVLDAFE